MRFIHITDTHIGASLDFTNYGHSPRRSLEILVEHLNGLTFDVDFILHTGDVVEDGSEAAYYNAKPMLEKLRLPVYYVAGNHDNADHLRKIILGQPPNGQRMDYQFECGGIQFAVFDTMGTNQPSGLVTEAQLDAMRALCTPDGPPLVMCLHHPPTPLDSGWLDHDSHHPHMLIENGAAVMEAIAPARARLRGLFFGHVHRAYQVFQGGVLLCSAVSAFAQLESWPGQPRPAITPHEPAGYNIVTVTPDKTIVRQIALPRE